MARPNAPRTVGSNPSTRPDPAPKDNSFDTLNRSWPFAKGSQNRLDETAAPWPRPASRTLQARAGPTLK